MCRYGDPQIRDYDAYTIAADTDLFGKCQLEPVKVKRCIKIIRIL